MKKILVNAIAFAMCATSQIAIANQVIKVDESSDKVSIGQPYEITLSFAGDPNKVSCGLKVDWGDGSIERIRVGNELQLKHPFKLQHSYVSSGKKSFKADGEMILRGLKTVMPCEVSLSGFVDVGQGTERAAAGDVKPLDDNKLSAQQTAPRTGDTREALDSSQRSTGQTVGGASSISTASAGNAAKGTAKYEQSKSACIRDAQFMRNRLKSVPVNDARQMEEFLRCDLAFTYGGGRPRGSSESCADINADELFEAYFVKALFMVSGCNGVEKNVGLATVMLRRIAASGPSEFGKFDPNRSSNKMDDYEMDHYARVSKTYLEAIRMRDKVEIERNVALKAESDMKTKEAAKTPLQRASESLQANYETYITLQKCYEARKDFGQQYVSKMELDNAKRWVKKAEQDAIAQTTGLAKEKDAIWKRAADKAPSGALGLLLTTSNWNRDANQLCGLIKMGVAIELAGSGSGAKKDF